MGVVKRTKALLLAAIMVVVPLFASGHAAAAGSASFSLSPTGGSFVKGSTLTVTVNVSSSDQINTVQADITYDAAKLQYASIDGSGSAFDFPLAASGGGGSVQIARGVSGGATVSGTKKLASVNFTVLVSGTTATLSFASSSAILSPGGSGTTNVWNGNTTGGSYTLTAPVESTPPPASGSSGSSGSGSSGGNKNNTPAQPSKPAQPAAPAQPASPEQPVVTSAPAANTKHLVAIKVVDKNDKTKKSLDVRLNGVTVKTDDKGIASFSDVPTGTHTVTVFTSKDVSTDMTIEVKDGDTTAVQSYTFKLPQSSSKKWMYLILIIPAAILIVGLILVVRSKLKNKLKNVYQGTAPAASAITGDFDARAAGVHKSLAEEGQPVAPPATVIRPTVTNETANETEHEKENGE